MKKSFIIILISLFSLLPSNIYALVCSNENKVGFQDKAKNISVNYEYQEIDNDVVFNIKITNIPENFILYDMKNHIEYRYQGPEISIPNLKKNTSYRYSVYVDDIACNHEMLYIHYITLPAYNSYYKDEVCRGIEDYKLCNKWLNVTISYDEWKKDVLEYKNTLNQDTETEEEETNENIFDKIIDFYADYYIFILPTIIIASFIGMYFYNKKHDLF